MHNLTMAMKICSENYPVALACLPASFALIPQEKVLGCWLVINEFGILDSLREGGTKHFALSHTWYEDEDFRNLYVVNQDQILTTPFHVRRK